MSTFLSPEKRASLKKRLQASAFEAASSRFWRNLGVSVLIVSAPIVISSASVGAVLCASALAMNAFSNHLDLRSSMKEIKQVSRRLESARVATAAVRKQAKTALQQKRNSAPRLGM